MWLIGCLAMTAQFALGQSPSDGEPWITASDRRYASRFRELLLSDSRRDLATGWQLARDLGRPVAPILWELSSRERSNVEKRLALVVGALLAAGPAAEDRLFSFLDQSKPLLQERAMAAFWVALGCQRSRPVPNVVSRMFGPNKEPSDLLSIAVRLAAARYPEASAGAAQVESNNPGVLAAAAFGGFPIARSSSQRQWRSQHRHAELFRRGAMLGAGWRVRDRGVPSSLVGAARQLLEDGDAYGADAREAALLLLARTGDLRQPADPWDWRQMNLVASQRSGRSLLKAALGPTPPARDPNPERLAVAYALAAPVEQIVAQQADWGGDERIRSHVAVALAARLCALEAPPRVEAALVSVPEWSLVVWASGGVCEQAATLADTRLAVLAASAADGRASRLAAQVELEQALWRWGSHPGITPWQIERQLVRDLLLVGSRGGGKYRPELAAHLRYFPTGLDRDDPFFDLAVALFDFTSKPAGPVPSEYRLF